MLDLSAKIFYKAQFIVAGQTDDLFADIIYVIKDWIRNKYAPQTRYWKWERFEFSEKFITPDSYQYPNKVRAETKVYNYEIDGFHAYRWAIKIVERDWNFPHVRSWINEIGIKQEAKENAVLSFLTYYTLRPGYIGEIPESPQKNVPGFIKNFLAGSICPHILCFSGNVNLTNKAKQFSNDNFLDFISLLFNLGRKCDIVFISPYKNGDSITYIINPDELAYSLSGNAVVCYTDSLSFTYRLSKEYPEYSCYNGAIRIYRPIVDPEYDNQRQHVLLRRDRFQDSPVTISDMLIRAFCEQISYDEIKLFTRLETCENLILQSSQKRLHGTHQKLKDEIGRLALSHDDIVSLNDTYEKILEDYDNDIVLLKQERDDLIDKCIQQEDEIRSLSYEREVFLKDVAQSYERVKSLETVTTFRESFLELPREPKDVMELFITLYNDRLDFSDRGKKSIQLCNTKPDLLWRVLYAMATHLWELYNSSFSGDIEDEFEARSGFKLSLGERKQTRRDSDFMNIRRDNYRGKDIFIIAHVKKAQGDKDPNAIRVYYHYIDEIKKIVVGHCGTHLPTYGTQFVR